MSPEPIPTGDPESVFCRWCHTGRVRGPGGAGLICVACDTNSIRQQGAVS